jgi:hypothetical protein
MTPSTLATEPAYNAGCQAERERTVKLLGLRIESLSLLPGRSPQAIVRELRQLQRHITTTEHDQ